MNDLVELRQVINIILKRWWMLLLVALIVTGIGYGISQIQERVYTATASVIVGQSIQAANLDTRDIQTSERLALTYADIVRRQPILEATIRTLNLGISWQELRNRVSVNLVTNTQLLEITVEAGSKEEAIAIANELSTQLILLSPSSVNVEDDESTRFVRQRLRAIQSQIETTQSEIVELSAVLDEAQTPQDREELQNEIAYLESMIVNWEDNYTRFLQFVGADQAVNNVTIVDDAYARERPVRPNIRLNTLIAAVVGLFLGFATIFVLDFLDDTIQNVEEISSDLRLTPLGSISKMRKRDFRGGLVLSKNPFLPVSESYRIIRNNILSMLLYVDTPGKSIMVTSPASGDGKSVTAVNLAVSMAQSGRKTIIVDTDVRWPILHEVFNIPDGDRPVSQLRLPDSSVTINIRRTDIERLYLLTAGDMPSNFSELLESERMDQFVNLLKEEADVVIFDSPPAALVADAAIMARHVDGVVLVVSVGKTERDALNLTVANLKRAGANILGVVLNRSEEASDSYYYKPTSRQRLLPNTKLGTSLKYAWKKMASKNWQKGRRRERIESYSKGLDNEHMEYPIDALHDDDILQHEVYTEDVLYGDDGPVDDFSHDGVLYGDDGPVDDFSHDGVLYGDDGPVGDFSHDGALYDDEGLVDDFSAEGAYRQKQRDQQEQMAQEEVLSEVDAAYTEDVTSEVEIVPHKKSNGLIPRKDLNAYSSEVGKEASLESQLEAVAVAQPPDAIEEMVYVVNKNGEKFHRPDCRYAENIDSEQYLEFTSRESAVDSGYTPCQVCKP